MTEERSKTVTDFRYGNVNLHKLHVNREKGRTCRACHNIHASDQYDHPDTLTSINDLALALMVDHRDHAEFAVVVVDAVAHRHLVGEVADQREEAHPDRLR